MKGEILHEAIECATLADGIRRSSNLPVSARVKRRCKSSHCLSYKTFVIGVPKGLVVIWGRPFLRVATESSWEAKLRMKLYKDTIFAVEIWY